MWGSPEVGVKTGKCKAGRGRQAQAQNPAEGCLDKRCRRLIIAQQNPPDGSNRSHRLPSGGRRGEKTSTVWRQVATSVWRQVATGDRWLRSRKRSHPLPSGGRRGEKGLHRLATGGYVRLATDGYGSLWPILSRLVAKYCALCSLGGQIMGTWSITVISKPLRLNASVFFGLFVSNRTFFKPRSLRI